MHLHAAEAKYFFYFITLVTTLPSVTSENTATTQTVDKSTNIAAETASQYLTSDTNQ